MFKVIEKYDERIVNSDETMHVKERKEIDRKKVIKKRE